MFVSLKFKAIVIVSLLLATLSGIVALQSELQLNRLSDNQHESNFERYAKEVSGLIRQSHNHLLQLGDIIPLLKTNSSGPAGEPLALTLDQHWEYIQINWGLESLGLFNRNGQAIRTWGSRIEHDSERLANLADAGLPDSWVLCDPSCFLRSATPILNANNELQILQFDMSMADVLRTFSEITGSDIGIITLVENAQETDATLSAWHSSLDAMTHRDLNGNILKLLSRNITIDQLRNENQEIVVDGQTYEVGLLPIERKFGETAYFTVIANISSEKQFIAREINLNIIGGIFSTLIACAIIVAMFWKPVTRLGRQASLLPLLTKGEFGKVRKELKTSTRKRWIKDEIDILDETELEVSIQLEKMQEKIESHTVELKNLAHFDSLTGLSNRRRILEEIRISLRNTVGQNDFFALLFIDLDNFKRINDSLGHGAGDELLIAVSKRLNSCVRSTDIVGRLGGDEFCIIVNNLKKQGDGASVACNVLNVLKLPIHVQRTEVIVSASIGIVLAPKDGDSIKELLQNADLAMYRAKALGRNKYQLFYPAMSEIAVERLSIENELRSAVSNEEFQLHYQAQVNLNTGEIIAAEALLRWIHPQKGLIMPDKFIDVLEETGLIVPVGEWVVQTACEALVRWRGMGLSPLLLSVNLSPRQFRDPNLCMMIEQSIASSGAPAENLELEITESMVMQDVESNNQLIQKLQSMGISFAIDDFGTGYSSFSYLKTLPVNTLKIDRTFIKDIPDDEVDMEITAAIVAVAHNLKLKVIAEGVETLEQQAFLMKLGCDLGQGYLYSKPVTEKAFMALVAEATVWDEKVLVQV